MTENEKKDIDPNGPLVQRGEEEKIDMGPTSKGGPVEVEDPQAKLEAEIEERLTKSERKSEDASTIARLVADPDIRKVMEARQKGQGITIVLDGEGDEGRKKLEEEKTLREKLADEDPPDLDTLSNKELTKLIIGKMADVTEQAIEASVRPLVERLDGVDAHISTQRTSVLQQQIDEAKEKHSDLEAFGPAMNELSQTAPGLSVEELYVIAKTRAGGFNAAPPESESERPSHDTSRPPVRDRRDAGKLSSRAFSHRIRDAAEKAVFGEDKR